MNIKNFLHETKEKHFKKMDKDARLYYLYDQLPQVVGFYIKQKHREKEQVAELFDRLANPLFMKTLKKLLSKKDEYEIDAPMATILADFLETRHSEINPDDLEVYTDCIDMLLKDRLKKMVKKVGIDKTLAKEVLVVIAEPEAISSESYIGLYVMRVLKKIYALGRDQDLELDTDKVGRMMNYLFGKDRLASVAINVLLERKESIRNFNENQSKLWNLFTDFALNVIEAHKKKEIAKILEAYIDRREQDAKRQKDSARRIQFASVSDEDFPKIIKAYRKLSEKEKFAQFL